MRPIPRINGWLAVISGALSIAIVQIVCWSEYGAYTTRWIDCGPTLQLAFAAVGIIASGFLSYCLALCFREGNIITQGLGHKTRFDIALSIYKEWIPWVIIPALVSSLPIVIKTAMDNSGLSFILIPTALVGVGCILVATLIATIVGLISTSLHPVVAALIAVVSTALLFAIGGLTPWLWALSPIDGKGVGSASSAGGIKPLTHGVYLLMCAAILVVVLALLVAKPRMEKKPLMMATGSALVGCVVLSTALSFLPDSSIYMKANCQEAAGGKAVICLGKYNESLRKPLSDDLQRLYSFFDPTPVHQFRFIDDYANLSEIPGAQNGSEGTTANDGSSLPVGGPGSYQDVSLSVERSDPNKMRSGLIDSTLNGAACVGKPEEVQTFFGQSYSWLLSKAFREKEKVVEAQSSAARGSNPQQQPADEFKAPDQPKFPSFSEFPDDQVESVLSSHASEVMNCSGSFGWFQS